MSKAETSYLYYYFCLDVINVCKFTEVQELIKGLFSFSYLLLAKMKERRAARLIFFSSKLITETGGN